jgi:D-alanyl-D-alanine carboxypeptidase (penicillin-binding protein 5/6)
MAVALVAVALTGSGAHAARLNSLTARSAIIMDATTGDVLWERDAGQPLPPASTTKIMTAILALESHRLDDSFTVSRAASQVVPSKINLRPGQEMRLRNLLYASSSIRRTMPRTWSRRVSAARSTSSRRA